MKNISIIGMGLIGGSLGLALKKKARGEYFITAVGRNPGKLRSAKRLGAADAVTTDFEAGVKDADIVVICTPVHLIAPMVRRVLPFVKRGAIITDAGSVKGPVCKAVDKVFKQSAVSSQQSVSFVGAHPMAGSEKSGIKAARAGLYEGAVVVLAGGIGSNKQALNEVKKMWRKTGAETIEMPEGRHDKAVALISHLPHIIAYTLCDLAGRMKATVPETSKLTAGSFKDLTRIAGSNSADWASISNANRKDISSVMDSFINELKAAKKALGKPGLLEKRFEKAKVARHKLLNKQDKSQ